MKSTFTGIRDLDVEILNRLDDRDLVSFCSTDKYANSICDLETFWQRRMIEKYGKYLNLESLLKFKDKKSWAEYYVEITKVLNSSNVEYETAKALENGRSDLVKLLKEIKHILVEYVEIMQDDLYESYFLTRKEGDTYFKKQGKYVMESDNERMEGQYLNGLKIGKWFNMERDGTYSINEYYQNGMMKSHELWHGSTLLEREYYDKNGEPILRTLWVKQYF